MAWQRRFACFPFPLWGPKWMRPLQWRQVTRKGEPNVHRSCTPGGPSNGVGTRRSTYPRGKIWEAASGGAKSGLRILDSETHSPTHGSQNPVGAKSQLRILELGIIIQRTLKRKRCSGKYKKKSKSSRNDENEKRSKSKPQKLRRSNCRGKVFHH